MAERFYLLLDSFKQFLEYNNCLAKFPQILEPEWLQKFEFLVDITFHLNQLNLVLQGENILLPDAISHIKAFKLILKYSGRD